MKLPRFSAEQSIGRANGRFFGGVGNAHKTQSQVVPMACADCTYNFPEAEELCAELGFPVTSAECGQTVAMTDPAAYMACKRQCRNWS
jgi:predicted amidophosphoribosyltransferase